MIEFKSNTTSKAKPTPIPDATPEMDKALIEIGIELKNLAYNFKAITPESHRRVLNRDVVTTSLQDIFGWNRPFSFDQLPDNILSALQCSDMLLTHDQSYTSQIRFASLYDHLYLHSGFPTQRQDAVFFGPDTYRYARLLHQHVEKAERVVDIGCGSGAGGLCLHKRVERICLADINSEALRYARINAELAGIANRVDVVNSNILANVNGEFDLVISNPPYMVDDTERTYRHGGQQLGSELSVRIAREGLQRLTVGGKLILYTASAIVNGVDTFWQSIQPVLEENNCEVYYDEIDPDVFGEELDRLAYQHTDRLAVVSLILKKRA